MITIISLFQPVRRVSVVLFFGAAITFAQKPPLASVSGRVLDDSTSIVLQNVNVFLSQTTLGCGTDQYGQFEIKNVPPGSYEIVASRVGYSVKSFRVTLVPGNRQFEIRLRPSTIRFDEVVVSATPPVEWKKQLEKFSQMFFGKTRNAKQCRILNPEVLDFVESGDGFTATARAPLEIENRALGYHLQFILTLFTTAQPSLGVSLRGGQVLKYEGLPRMVSLVASSADETSQWNENRLRVYRGSMRHFLSSLVKMEVEKEGFEMSLVPRVLGVRAEVYDPASSPYFPGVQGSEWNSRREEVNAAALVSKTRNPAEWNVRYKGYLEVVYKLEPVERGYDLLMKKGTDAQVSWLGLNVESMTVNDRGLIKEMWPTNVYGYWGWTRVADMLPLDYEPVQE